MSPRSLTPDSEHTLLDMKGMTAQGQKPGPGEFLELAEQRWTKPFRKAVRWMSPQCHLVQRRQEEQRAKYLEDSLRTSGAVRAGGICGQCLETARTRGSMENQKLDNVYWRNGVGIRADLPLWDPNWIRILYCTLSP